MRSQFFISNENPKRWGCLHRCKAADLIRCFISSLLTLLNSFPKNGDLELGHVQLLWKCGLAMHNAHHSFLTEWFFSKFCSYYKHPGCIWEEWTVSSGRLTSTQEIDFGNNGREYLDLPRAGIFVFVSLKQPSNFRRDTRIWCADRAWVVWNFKIKFPNRLGKISWISHLLSYLVIFLSPVMLFQFVWPDFSKIIPLPAIARNVLFERSSKLWEHVVNLETQEQQHLRRHTRHTANFLPGFILNSISNFERLQCNRFAFHPPLSTLFSFQMKGEEIFTRQFL